jgi:hypothetical protein
MAESNEQNTTVQFTTVDPSTMKFSEDYRCARSTAGQVIVGLRWLANNVNTSKEMNNEYQKNLYPTISKLANEVCDKYMENFVNDVKDKVQIQVYGANLNGRFNDGRLKHDIPCKKTDRRARYKYSVLGQLLSLLYDRLLFISHRDVSKIQRYVDNEEERKHFESLQQQCAQFCKYLRGEDDSVMSKWTTFVNESRQSLGVQPKEKNPVEQKQQSATRGRGSSRGRGFSRGRESDGEQGFSRGRGTGTGRGFSRGRGNGTGRGRGSEPRRGRGQ